MTQIFQDSPTATRTPEAATATQAEDSPTVAESPSPGVLERSSSTVPSAMGSEPTKVTGGGEGAPPPSVAPPTLNGRKALLITTVLCVVLGAGGHLLLLVGWAGRTPGQTGNSLPWQPVVGASLTAVAIMSFGGFYYATLRARVAIMSSFILTFLLLLTYVLTVREVQPGGDQPLVQALIDDFRIIVQTIVGFYFGTETVLSLTKILRAPRGDGASIRRADRDLPAG